MKTVHNFTDDWGRLFIVLALTFSVPTLTGVLLYYA